MEEPKVTKPETEPVKQQTTNANGGGPHNASRSTASGVTGSGGDGHGNSSSHGGGGENRGQGGFRRGGGGAGGSGRFPGNRRGGNAMNNSHSHSGGNKNYDDNKKRFSRNLPSQQQMTPLNQDGGPPGRNLDRMMHDKLNEIAGPTYELPPLDTTEKKFSGRSRLYIGNLPQDVTDDEINELFKKFGEVSELFLNREKNFGFVRMDFHFNAERAKNELNGTVIKNRTLKIRFAPNGSTVKVKNLDEFVTNELLHLAFSVFGEVDRAVVVLDDRGKTTGEGIVEFARKNSAMFAVRKCTDCCFFLTTNIRPVLVELYDAQDENDGYSERFQNKKNQDFFKHRSIGPRIAGSDSFEHDYGMRWKQLYELHRQKLAALNKELEIDQNKLIAQMEYARYEHDTAMLREQLRAREMDMDRQKREWEIKQQQAEEERRRTDEHMRRQEEEIQTRMMHQEEEIRRRQQENNLFMQAQQLDNMLDHQEQAYVGGSGGGGGNVGQPDDLDNRMFQTGVDDVPNDSIMEQKVFVNSYERGGSGGGGGGGGGGRYDRGGSGGGSGGGNVTINAPVGGGGDQQATSMRGGGGGHGGHGGGGGGRGFWGKNNDNNAQRPNDNYNNNKRRRF